jgi:hypothetical protein
MLGFRAPAGFKTEKAAEFKAAAGLAERATYPKPGFSSGSCKSRMSVCSGVSRPGFAINGTSEGFAESISFDPFRL